MDPNTALNELRAALREYHTPGIGIESDDAWHALEAIAEYAEALDEWLSKGGFLPDAWATVLMQALNRQANR